MNDKAAFEGDYVDLKFLKSRKVMQVWIELPIEAGVEFVAAFGTPDPSRTVPVALARLTGSAGVVTRADKGKEAGDDGAITLPSSEPERPKGGNLAQRAGILCGEGAFGKFIAREKGFGGELAQFIRQHCGINSRSELDHNPEAARKFRELEGQYRAWRQF